MNFHRKPFDEGTLEKLYLFRSYTKEWLPVFLSNQQGGTITIVDFFAGPGRDSAGNRGSPLVILDEIRKYTPSIRTTGTRIRLELNEAVKWKAKSLREVMEAQKIPKDLCEWRVYNLKFHEAFDTLYSEMVEGPNLLFLDQQGMKFISDDVFARIRASQNRLYFFYRIIIRPALLRAPPLQKASSYPQGFDFRSKI